MTWTTLHKRVQLSVGPLLTTYVHMLIASTYSIAAFRRDLLTMLLIAVLSALPLTVGATCFRHAERVSITGEGCIPQWVTVWQLVCTENPDPANGTANTTTTLCSDVNYTTVKTVLWCHDGYDLHTRRVLSQVRIRNNSENCTREIESELPHLTEPPTSSSWPLAVYKVVQPAIVVIGLTGNLLSLLVMSSKILRQFSFSVYLQTLAVVDSLVLFHYGLNYLGILNNTNDSITFFMKGYAACMIYPYLVRVAQLSSVWCVVGFTVDRAIAICKPFMACQHLTTSRSRRIAGGIIIVIMLSQIYHLILLNPKTEFCHDPFSFRPSASRLDAVEVLVLISKGTFLIFLPFLIVLVCNVKVISAVKRKTLDSSSNSERRMSLKLLSVSVTFLLLSLPEAVLSFIDFTNILSGVDNWFLKHKNFRCMAKMIFTLNFAINYFLYGIVFRKQVLLCASCRKSH